MRSESVITGIDDGLRIDRRCIPRDEGLETVGEDGLAEAEEQGSAEVLTEHHQRHGHGNLGGWERILDSKDGLWEG